MTAGNQAAGAEALDAWRPGLARLAASLLIRSPMAAESPRASHVVVDVILFVAALLLLSIPAGRFLPIR